MARAGRTGRQLPACLWPSQLRAGTDVGRLPLGAEERACGTQLRTQAAMGPGAKFGQSELLGRLGLPGQEQAPSPAGHAQAGPAPAQPAAGLLARLILHPPQVLAISSMAGCEPTWLGDTSPGLGGPRAIGRLLLVTLSKVVQVAHIARLHAHEARETLHVIVPGGVRGQG